jgi:S1-C subfamily serine protease
LSLVVLLVFLAPARAYADYDRSRLWFNGLSDWERRGIQTNLILTGFYSGFADAKFGRNTYEALLAFESRHSIFPNGILSGFESGRLVQLAQRWRDGMQFRDERDALAGVVLPIPHALVGASKGGERGAIWDGNNGVRVETAGYAVDDLSFDVVYALMSDPKISPGVKYRSKNDELFVISGEGSGWKYYRFFQKSGAVISGFTVSWSPQIDDAGSRIAVYLASKASFFAPVATPPSVRNAVQGQDASASTEKAGTQSVQSSGSGFIVSATGLILTNHHVIDGCSTIRVPRFGKAELLRDDPGRDLAAILVDRPGPTQPTATFEDSSPSLGSSVVVGGFPLSELFASDFTIALGSVTGRRGVAGNDAQFSISAPVQPGNSGGPVINEHGRIVGITVGKLNDAKMIEVVGSTGANFGFAIDAAKAHDFLRPFLIEERPNSLLSVDRSERYDNETLAKVLESFSVQVLCEAVGK